MAKKELLTLLQSASVKDLKELLALKKELVTLEKKEKALLKQFASVSKDIGSIQTAFGRPGRGRTGRPCQEEGCTAVPFLFDRGDPQGEEEAPRGERHL